MNALSSYKILTITHKSTALKNIGNFILPGMDCSRHFEDTLQAIKTDLQLDELLYVSTCNRVLFFFVSNRDANQQFIEHFQSCVYPTLPADLSLASVSKLYTGEQAVYHLLSVASSVDSMVIGEREILRQLREAYDRCYEASVTGDCIRLAIRLAVESAKEVYSTTRIGQKPVSVVSLAVRELLAKNPDKTAKILIIGAGQTNTLAGKLLLKYGFTNFEVFNRSLSRAQSLAKMLDCPAHKLEDLSEYKDGFDVMIACTGATEPVVTTDIYTKIIGEDISKKIIIDLSIPNNIEQNIIDAFFTAYIEIDGLKQIVNQNIAFRETELVNVQSILSQRVQNFTKIFKARQVELAMREVPTQIKAIRHHALSEVFKQEVSSLDEDVQELINRMMTYMEKRCIAIPLKAAKEHLAGVISTKK